MSFYLLLEAKEGISYKKEEIEELALELETIEDSVLDTYFECNELFLDVTANYKEQGIYTEFLDGLIDAADLLEEQMTSEELEKEINVFEEHFKDYEKLMRNYLVSEVFGQLVLPDYEWEDVVIAMQWIGIEYAMMRQSLFLNFLKEKELSYETVKKSIVYIARMTGYDEADVREYLEECFESLIWEWGYFALLIGNRRRKK